MVNLETKSSMTSVLNSATSAAHHAKKAEKLSHSKASGHDNSGADGEFGALFGTMMGSLEGQNLAALDGNASPPLVGLAAQILGPAVHIITTSAPTLSDDSLYAFAQSQGMDEDALALIFQKPGLPLMPGATGTVVTGNFNLAQGLDGLKSLNENSQPTAQLAADAASETGSLDLGDDASVSWSLGKAADGLPGTQTSFFGLNGVRNLMSAAPTVQAAPTDPADHPESAHQNLAASLILGASEAAQFARRLETKQATQRAERVAPGWLPPTAAGTGPTLPSDMILLPEETKIAMAETLLIATDIALDDITEVLSGRSQGGEGRATSANDHLGTSSISSAPRPDQAQRSEQYERLSQRLGEALGQRLAAQIAKGDWRVDLALKPYELGNIDIELNMKEGALQASFSAGQALTRELIADSLPRLKEILNQLGMDVAKMDVNVRQNSQHGGNPTPGHSSSGSGGQAGKDKTEKVGEVSTSMATRNISKGPDGLDVLV